MEQNNNNQNTALLVMDVQEATVKMLQDNMPLINNIKKVIQTARDNKIPVIYVVVGFRKGYPDMSPDNKSFAAMKSGIMILDTEEAFKVHASVEPQPGDIIIIKKRVSAFTGSDLEVVLRSLGIKHLLLSGIATSGVVLSTIREAADKDYVITVLSDCCADRDEEVHRVLTTKIFPRQAEVVTSEEWCNANHL
ncbi:MAG: cysteine hydrolase [Bacteroidota bacterium]|nr:cysteine hydrolase [Bacteroidota bacterium]